MVLKFSNHLFYFILFFFKIYHVFAASQYISKSIIICNSCCVINCVLIHFVHFCTTGITNFDLLGDFGSIEWLDNFVIVIVYNFIFAVVVTLTVLNKFTAKVRREVYARLVENYVFLSNCVSFLN